MYMEEKIYWLGFSLAPGIGPVLFEKILKKFGTAKSAWESNKKDLEKVVGPITLGKFLAFRQHIDLEKEYEKIVQKKIHLITLEDKAYPLLLQQVPHAPFLLYVKGNAAILSEKRILAIVGTRKITDYGRRVTSALTTELVSQGFVIVSGLAFGVDATAHMSTIQAKGKTIAVLGCGVDCCTPPSNQKIYDAILASGGAIVSAFPPGMQATLGSFPARNAIIAGLSQGIVVTEGAADSGALITAADASSLQRPVFAVPGPITSALSTGANNLLKKGATAVTSATDILDSLGIMGTPNRQRAKGKVPRGNTKEEQDILEILESGPLHFDEIVRRIKKDSKTTGSLLSLMELSGLIHQESGRYYL